VKVRPLYDRIIVKPDTPEEMKGKLHIPDKYREKRTTGEVLIVGPGRYEDGKYSPMGVKVGDKVMYGSLSGIPIQEDCLMMREQDVLAILEEEDVSAEAKEEPVVAEA